ncbi:MAG: hypothetical protein GY935_04545 [Gammaproteobacteria bacterium]|nr:hypothetical protein [Gammaproteobacteria bacterium]
MNNAKLARLAGLTLTLLLSACASETYLEAPDTKPGDQLHAEYLFGEWCSNRELTSQANKDAGHSAMINLTQVFWRFNDDGSWDDSASGWMYSSLGKWNLQGRDYFILEVNKGKSKNYQASFRNSGTDLYLQDEENQFLILSRCE